MGRQDHCSCARPHARYLLAAERGQETVDKLEAAGSIRRAQDKRIEWRADGGGAGGVRSAAEIPGRRGGFAMTYTFGEKLSCVERELALRKQVYPSQIRVGRMTKEFCDTQIAIMEEIRDDYA